MYILHQKEPPEGKSGGSFVETSEIELAIHRMLCYNISTIYYVHFLTKRGTPGASFRGFPFIFLAFGKSLGLCPKPCHL